MTGTVKSTFERYAKRLEAHRLVETGAISAAGLVEAVTALDRAVAGVEGHGFEVTPFGPQPKLAAAVGLAPSSELWVKDETDNVSGSHKARHLFGVALMHQLEADTDKASSPYAIASCGNAALAAAVVARAVGRPLDVYVPDWANQTVVGHIAELGARVVRCKRKPGVLGDPAHHAFLAAIEAGATPFSCQGTETPTAIDGGRTISYEMIDALMAHEGGAAEGRTSNGGPAESCPATARFDRVLVQVGGGALASAVVTGLSAAVHSGVLRQLPRVHAVQPVGNHPLVRAWDTLVADLLNRPAPDSNRDRVAATAALGRMADSEVRTVMARLRQSPSRYMRAWEKPPVSYATGILDDITYDWLPIAEAMLRSGGHPVVASERDLRRAHRLAHTHTGIDVCPTGAAGLGGLLALVASIDAVGARATGTGTNTAANGTNTLDNGVPSGFGASERIAVLFTGRMRPGDPAPHLAG